MTRADCENRKAELEAKRDALVDQLADTDVTSASLSAGGGSKSYTNRGVSELKAKIKFLEREIAKLDARLGNRRSPSVIGTIVTRYH